MNSSSPSLENSGIPRCTALVVTSTAPSQKANQNVVHGIPRGNAIRSGPTAGLATGDVSFVSALIAVELAIDFRSLNSFAASDGFTPDSAHSLPFASTAVPGQRVITNQLGKGRRNVPIANQFNLKTIQQFTPAGIAKRLQFIFPVLVINAMKIGIKIARMTAELRDPVRDFSGQDIC